MGYTTEFEGSIKVEPAITPELKDYINRLASTRRMKRDIKKLKKLDPKCEYGLDGDFGVEGEFYAKDDGDCGQTHDISVVDFNEHPSTQPGLWLQWNISKDGTEIGWDGCEKFYDADDWMTYIIDKILAPRGYVCNGNIMAYGENDDDVWELIVKDNIVTIENRDPKSMKEETGELKIKLNKISKAIEDYNMQKDSNVYETLRVIKEIVDEE